MEANAESWEYMFEDEDYNPKKTCPMCLKQDIDRSFLSKLGNPWLAHPAKLKISNSEDAELELTCYVSAEKFEKFDLQLVYGEEGEEEEVDRLFMSTCKLSFCQLSTYQLGNLSSAI